jgi:uncharacterized membrane protein YgdD (TMEM256/DUF423 family)
MTTMIWVYLGYLAICILVTVMVARTLRAHGPVFITGTNSPPTPIVSAKTHLLVVGFYLICLGLIAFALKFGGDAADAKTGIELISTKIGGMIFIIGFMHFTMVAIFASIKKEAKPIYVADPN